MDAMLTVTALFYKHRKLWRSRNQRQWYQETMQNQRQICSPFY